jgi:DNA-binding transcriptional regulator YiaG
MTRNKSGLSLPQQVHALIAARRFAHAGEIGAARVQAGINPDAAALLCGVSERTFRRWESGEAKAPVMAARLLQARAGDLGVIHEAWRGWRIAADGLLRDAAAPLPLDPGYLRAAWWTAQAADALRCRVKELEQEVERLKSRAAMFAPANEAVYCK